MSFTKQSVIRALEKCLLRVVKIFPRSKQRLNNFHYEFQEHQVESWLEKSKERQKQKVKMSREPEEGHREKTRCYQS